MPGNATVFEFQDGNATVRTYMNTAERSVVTAWQPNGLKWKIELHPGHPQGEPFYIRLNASKDDSSNIPKVDTKNHTAAEYADVKKIKNYDKLQSGLTSTEVTQLQTFIRTNFASLTLIAKRWWTNQVAPADPPAPATDKACTATVGCAGRVPIVTSGKAACDTCYAYQ